MLVREIRNFSSEIMRDLLMGLAMSSLCALGRQVTGDSDHAKRVNQKKIVGQLEKIVASFQLQAEETSMLDGNQKARRSDGALKDNLR